MSGKIQIENRLYGDKREVMRKGRRQFLMMPREKSSRGPENEADSIEFSLKLLQKNKKLLTQVGTRIYIFSVFKSESFAVKL